MKKIIARNRYRAVLNKIESHRFLTWLESATTPELMKMASGCSPKTEAAINQLNDKELLAIVRGEPCPRFTQLMEAP